MRSDLDRNATPNLNRADFTHWLEGLSVSPSVKWHILQLQDQGYTIIKKGLDASLISQAIADYEQSVVPFWKGHESSHDLPDRIVRLTDSHCLLPSVRDVFSSMPLPLAVADAIFGSPSAAYSSLFYKYSSESGIHLDVPAFLTVPAQHCLAIWVALEDTHSRNGALHVIPYAHRVQPPSPKAFASQYFENLEERPNHEIWKMLWDPYHRVLVDTCLQQGLAVKDLYVEAGDVIMWHPQMPHGAAKAADKNLTRRSIAFHATPVGVPVYQTDVYFKEQKPSSTWDKTYSLHNGRYFLDGKASFTLKRKRYLADSALATP